MADGLSIKDLPDSSKIEDQKNYLVPGHWLKTVLAVLDQLWRGENLGRGPGIRLRQGGEAGCTISAANQDGSGGSGAPPPTPLQVVDASAGSSPQVKVVYGIVGGQVPTIDGTTLTPTLTDPACPILTLDSGAEIVYVEVDISAPNPTTGAQTYMCSISSSDSSSPPANTIASDGSGSIYLILAGVTVTTSGTRASVAVSKAVSGSLGYLICGGNAYWGNV